MQPAAQKVADNAEPVAEDIIKKVIDPAVQVSRALTQQHSCHTELHWLQCFLRGAAQQSCQACEASKEPTAGFTELLDSLCRCTQGVRCPCAGHSEER